MNDKEIQKALAKKVDTAWDIYMDSLRHKSPDELIGRAGEIARMDYCRQELSSGNYPTQYAEYLLRFEDPLAVVHDQWANDQPDASATFECTLWRIFDTQDAEAVYAIDPNYGFDAPKAAPFSPREMGAFHFGSIFGRGR